MAATAKWLDSDTIEVTVGTAKVVRKVRDGDLDGFPELHSGRPGRLSRDLESAPNKPTRRRKAKTKADV